MINKSNSIFVLDWDDTLFPTTWVTKNNIDVTKHHSVLQFINVWRTLDKKISKLLSRMLKHANVIIVTNATLEWVRITSELLPYSKKILKRIPAVSARQNQCTAEMENWKKIAFQNLLSKKIEQNKLVNIISVGDAEYEYNALISLYTEKNKHMKLLKSVKFVRYPTYDKLFDQLDMLYNNVDKIHENRGHMDLKFISY